MAQPTFEEVQTWALANGYSGASDDEAYAAYEAAHPKAAAWMVPRIMTFSGVVRTNCPKEMIPILEGSVIWGVELIGDSEPVTDKDGVVHKPRALVYADEQAPQRIDGWIINKGKYEGGSIDDEVEALWSDGQIATNAAGNWTFTLKGEHVIVAYRVLDKRKTS